MLAQKISKKPIGLVPSGVRSEGLGAVRGSEKAPSRKSEMFATPCMDEAYELQWRRPGFSPVEPAGLRNEECQRAAGEPKFGVRG